MAITGDSFYNPVTLTADSQGILADCVPQLKLTAGKASGKLFDLLNLLSDLRAGHRIIKGAQATANNKQNKEKKHNGALNVPI